MEWVYQQQVLSDIPEGYYGFVYNITNILSNKQYIGKKFFYSQKQRQVKGKKKKYKVESDWKEYYGSNEELKKDIELNGKENFTRTIIQLCKTKGECSYYEAKHQFQENVLFYPELFYNSWIMCKVHRKHLKLTDAE